MLRPRLDERRLAGNQAPLPAALSVDVGIAPIQHVPRLRAHVEHDGLQSHGNGHLIAHGDLIDFALERAVLDAARFHALENLRTGGDAIRRRVDDEIVRPVLLELPRVSA
jgi:hypothetical protein